MRETVNPAVMTPAAIPAILSGKRLMGSELQRPGPRHTLPPRCDGAVLHAAGKAPSKSGGKKEPPKKKKSGPGKLKDGGGGGTNPH